MQLCRVTRNNVEYSIFKIPAALVDTFETNNWKEYNEI